ncbi:hypothetical protein V8F20_010620 [Naviculisporaceae sp. PSN 640]
MLYSAFVLLLVETWPGISSVSEEASTLSPNIINPQSESRTCGWRSQQVTRRKSVTTITFLSPTFHLPQLAVHPRTCSKTFFLPLSCLSVGLMIH